MPDSLAWIASSVLVSNPVLSSIWLICVLTVEKLMFSLIRAAFNQRRKTLANALKNSPLLQFSKEEIESSILRIDKKVTVRGEELSLEEFAKLTGILKEIHG